MRSLLYVMALGMVAAVAVWAYRVNYDTLNALDRVSDLQSQIAREREAIAILRAEWAYLNAPERLARLSLMHEGELGLAPMGPDHFAETQMVAFPPPPPLPPAPPYVEPPLKIENNEIASAEGVARMFDLGARPSHAAPVAWTLAAGTDAGEGLSTAATTDLSSRFGMEPPR